MSDMEGGAPADGGQGVDPGASMAQAVESAKAGLDAQPEQPSAPFFEIEDEKGKKISFRDAEHLKKEFGNYGMMRGDYQRKTQELADQRRNFEAQMAEFQKTKEKYDGYDKFLKDNSWMVKQIEEAQKKGLSGHRGRDMVNSMIEQAIQPYTQKIEEMEQALQARDMASERDRIMEDLGGRYEDFDRQAVEAMLEEVDPNDMGGLLELLYHAAKGKSGGDQAAQAAMERQAKAQEVKSKARVVPSGGGAPPSGKSFNSIEEAREEAKKAIAG